MMIQLSLKSLLIYKISIWGMKAVQVITDWSKNDCTIRAVSQIFWTNSVPTCHYADLSMADVGARGIVNFTGVPSRSVFVALMKTFQDAGVLNDFCVVSVWSVELLAILVPSDKQLRRSSESAFQPQLIAHWNRNVSHLHHKASRLWGVLLPDKAPRF